MKVPSLLKIVCTFRYCIYGLWWRCRFQSFGYRSVIISPIGIDGSENIRIENRVFVAYKTWLAALPHTGESTCLLEFQDGVTIEHFGANSVVTRDILDYCVAVDAPAKVIKY